MFSKNEIAFFVYFIPLFGLKLLDITADSFLLKLVGVACFVFSLTHIIDMHYGKRVFDVLAVLFCFSALLVVTCGKQAMFFSVVMLILMYRVNMDRKIYPLLMKCGLVFMLGYVLYSYLLGDVRTEMRYMNGEWVEMAKRSNILFVGYMAVVSLYLLANRRRVTKMMMVGILLTSFPMYGFVGSRTGMLVTIFLILMLAAFRLRLVRRNLIVKWLCILSPLYCMVFCIYTGVFFGRHSWLTVLDMLLQGRVTQNSMFLHDYDILPFGQRIVEGSDVGGVFLNLDCAYLDMLICEGLIYAVLWTIASIVVIRYFYDKERMVEVSLLVMYAFYGITETFLPNCFLNISLFLYGEYFYHILKVPPEFRIVHLKIIHK